MLHSHCIECSLKFRRCCHTMCFQACWCLEALAERSRICDQMPVCHFKGSFFLCIFLLVYTKVVRMSPTSANIVQIDNFSIYFFPLRNQRQLIAIWEHFLNAICISIGWRMVKWAIFDDSTHELSHCQQSRRPFSEFHPRTVDFVTLRRPWQPRLRLVISAWWWPEAAASIRCANK